MPKRISLKMPLDFTAEDLLRTISQKTSLPNPSYSIASQSLDARKKDDIHYFLHLDVDTAPIPKPPPLQIPKIQQQLRAVVVGFGPAGYFAALVLARAGFSVTVLEKGRDVSARTDDISRLDSEGVVDPDSNYLFGEGGAGTFSDGKLTSRSKSIYDEKRFVISTYIDAGAPEEIEYHAHPHLGSDRLRNIMPRLRAMLEAEGGTIHFQTKFISFCKTDNVFSINTSNGVIDTDILIIAPGHSSFETYRSLIDCGVPFHTKPFAAGTRVEHPQEMINQAQWKRSSLPGLNAAEYRLTLSFEESRIYSFCMCPGGTIIPAAASKIRSGVNGASLYARDGHFANAAIVSAFVPEKRFQRAIMAQELLDYLEAQNRLLFSCTDSLSMPACKISDFIAGKVSPSLPETSYPLGIVPYDFSLLFDSKLCSELRMGFADFSNKIRGFEDGIMVGTEFTTSAPLQCERDRYGAVSGFSGLYLCGEGSGYAGGIISSAADGVRCALHIAQVVIN
ncbi:MAG: NAD(P)-binding protein [Spirochaetes bacterium]|jgi:uncharacterized FAD-dependent dehydrogenase|nr:NAD(P)-binding protein [Spirochaetota bacterium]